MNLTNFKKEILPNGKTSQYTPHLFDQLDRANQFEGKLDKYFCAVGHSYTMSFDVIREAYWLKYDIITHLDCSLYDTLYFFIRKKIPFSLDVLAKRMKVSKETLRQSLDNLENAELLEVVKVNDVRGQYNCYLLKTPLFERDSIEYDYNQKPDSFDNQAVKRNRQKFHDKSLPLPQLFLDNHIERLCRQVKKNSVKKARMFARNAFKTNRFKSLADELKLQRENRQLVWKEVHHTLGSLAVDFEGYVFSITKAVSIIPAGEYKAALKRFIKKFCDDSKIKFTSWILDKAEKLIRFFRYRLRIPQTKAENEAIISEKEITETEENSKRENLSNQLIRKILEDKTAFSRKTQSWHKSTISDLRRYFSEQLKFINLAELEVLAAEFIPVAIREKVFVELRN